MKNSISRRAFLKESMTATGLTIAVVATPFGCTLSKGPVPGAAVSPSFKPNVWLEMTPDEKIAVTVGQSELGQGTHTAFAMILADELEADWKRIQVRPGGARDEFKNPLFPIQMTAGSLSVRSFFELLREVGATGRVMLVKAAALTWKVPEEECAAAQGAVSHGKSGRSLTYGQLCLKAAELPIPEDPDFKDDEDLRLIGTYVPRLDIPDKVAGKAIFGMDFSVPGMLIAVLARPPAYGAKVLSQDGQAAANVKGVRTIVTTPNGIAVVAETLDAAWEGRDVLNVKWGPGSHPYLDNDAIERIFEENLDKAGVVAVDDGDPTGALSAAAQTVKATYFCSYVSHSPLEPMNCTARVRKNRCDVWVPTQGQTLSQFAAAQTSGLPVEKVYIHTLYSGGAFGRRTETDFVVEAVAASKACGKPVKVVWTREEDTKNGFYRPANIHRISAGLDSSGQLSGWTQKVVSPSINSRVFPQLVKNGLDSSSLGGIWDPSPGGSGTAYKIPNFHLELVQLNLPIPVGFLRSVQNGPNAFVMESLMDELARAAGTDPVAFRLGLLKHNKRAHRVLKLAAEKAGWGSTVPAGQGRGVAQHFCFGSYVAQVADVSVNRNDGKIIVHKIVAAVDCGPAVAPANIRTQMEGGITLALSTSLKEEVAFSQGGVESANYDDYSIMRMNEVPEIEVHIVESADFIGGIGEPSVPPTAPAVANAVFDAVGIRLRRLPMNPKTVLTALGNA